MEVVTTRFGSLSVADGDLLAFPEGLPGLEDCRHFVLLPDMRNDAIAWLQSTTAPEVALPVVSPRRFVSDYKVRVDREELQPLAMTSREDAQVLAVVSVHEGQPTMNLKAPLVINLRSRIGRQVVTNGDMPLRHVMPGGATQQRQAA